jgi:hypothetical protein|eukprot:COSAG06_NODE_1039_length_10995_cov_47.088106_10_plen_61_part_00
MGKKFVDDRRDSWSSRRERKSRDSLPQSSNNVTSHVWLTGCTGLAAVGTAQRGGLRREHG